MFDNEKQGPPVYCRFKPSVKRMAEEWAQRWDCHLHEAINQLTFLGAICAWFAANIAPDGPNGQEASRIEMEDFLNKILGPVRSG